MRLGQLYVPPSLVAFTDYQEGGKEKTDAAAVTSNASSTFRQNLSERGFFASVTDESRASGMWMSDAFALEGVTLPRLPMGLADDANRFLGALGLGFNDSRQDGVADVMAQQGLIASSGYSLWLDNERPSSPEPQTPLRRRPGALTTLAATGTKSGNILFGAIDAAKFSGGLRRFRASHYSPVYGNIGVPLFSLGVRGLALGSLHDIPQSDPASERISSSDDPLAMALTHANPLSNFPTEVANELWALAGAKYDAISRSAIIPCSGAGNLSLGTVTLRFVSADGPTLEFPLSDLTVSPEVTEGLGWSSTTASNDTKWCLFGVQNSTHPWGTAPSLAYSLGASMLRRAYTVVDLVNSQVALAPVRFDVAERDVVAFERYAARIPRSEPYCPYVNSVCESETSTYDGSRLPNTRAWPVVAVAIGATLGALVVFLAVIAALILTKRGYCGGARKVDVKEKGVEPPPSPSVAPVPTRAVQTPAAAGAAAASDAHTSSAGGGGEGDWPLSQAIAGSEGGAARGPLPLPRHSEVPVSPVSSESDETPPRGPT